MSENTPNTPTLAALRHRRELTIARLCEHFAADHLLPEELEELIDRAHQANSLVALDQLLDGLPELSSDPARKGMAITGPIDRDSQAMVVAVMGGVERKGAWTPSETNYVIAVMGGSLLDFREARLPPGDTNIVVFAIMGGVEIIVPPGLRVESNGIGIMGAFEHAGDAGQGSGGGPVLRISGLAMMGAVEIKVRPPKGDRR